MRLSPDGITMGDACSSKGTREVRSLKINLKIRDLMWGGFDAGRVPPATRLVACGPKQHRISERLLCCALG